MNPEELEVFKVLYPMGAAYELIIQPPFLAAKGERFRVIEYMYDPDFRVGMNVVRLEAISGQLCYDNYLFYKKIRVTPQQMEEDFVMITE